MRRRGRLGPKYYVVSRLPRQDYGELSVADCFAAVRFDSPGSSVGVVGGLRLGVDCREGVYLEFCSGNGRCERVDSRNVIWCAGPQLLADGYDVFEIADMIGRSVCEPLVSGMYLLRISSDAVAAVRRVWDGLARCGVAEKTVTGRAESVYELASRPTLGDYIFDYNATVLVFAPNVVIVVGKKKVEGQEYPAIAAFFKDATFEILPDRWLHNDIRLAPLCTNHV